jgi:hypothetical protein
MKLSMVSVGHWRRRLAWPWIRQTFERSQDAYRQIRKEGRVPLVVADSPGLAVAAGSNPFSVYALCLEVATLLGYVVAYRCSAGL